MVRVAIIEDIKQQSDILTDYLKSFFLEEKIDFLIKEYSNGVDFLENYTAQYDLVFLDIEMPILNGIETAKRLRKVDSRVDIIFVTNMAQYAAQGYEVDAVGYLVKPYTYINLCLNMRKVLKHIKSREEVKIVVATRQGITVVPSSALKYVEIRKHELIYYTDSETLINRGTLKDVEEQLEKHFFARCNNCYLVNLRYVRSVCNNSVKVDKMELPISRSKKKEFIEKFMRYVSGSYF